MNLKALFTSSLWKTGTALGLLTGGLLVLLLHNGWHNNLGIDKAVRWLASCPPLSWDWVMQLQRELQYGILILWWTVTGAALGWLLDGNKADKACAILLIVTLISAHQLSYDNLGLAIERHMNNFKMEIDRIF